MINTALDQAVGLRRLARPAGVRLLPVFGGAERVPGIVNLASALARNGQRVLVVDASRGELAPAFGLSARYELKHVLDGDISLAHAMLRTRDGVQVLPAARGIAMLTQARVSGLDFFESLAERASAVDLIIINIDAGERAMRLIPAHGEALLVLPRGAQAASDGLACLRLLAARRAMTRFRVLMMRTAFTEARDTVDALAQHAAEELDLDVTFGGNAPPDRHLWEAARVRRTIFDIDPAGPVARAFHNAAAAAIDWDLAMVAATRAFPQRIANGASHAAATPLH